MKTALAAPLLAAVVLALGAGEAAADVVMPEPEGCPAGTVGATCHGGPHCRPLTCTGDSDCQGGKVCQDLALCTGIVNCAGMIMPDEDPSKYDTTKVISACDAGGACASGTCTTLKVCAAPATPQPEPAADAGGASVPGSGSAGKSSGCAAASDGALGAWLSLLGLLALLALAWTARAHGQRPR